MEHFHSSSQIAYTKNPDHLTASPLAVTPACGLRSTCFQLVVLVSFGRCDTYACQNLRLPYAEDQAAPEQNFPRVLSSTRWCILQD
jgi:hypothetical protein